MEIGIKNLLGYFQNNDQLPVNENTDNKPDFVAYDIKNLIPDEKNRKYFASLASILSVENGYFGTRSCFEECYCNISTGATYIAGIYTVNDDGITDKLAVMPDWTRVCVYVEDELFDIESQKVLEHRRLFDIKQGISVREVRFEDAQGRVTRLRTEKFSSLTHKHFGGQSVTIIPENYSGNISVRTGIDGNIVNVDDAIFHYQKHPDSVTLDITLPEKKFKDGEVNFTRQVSMTKMSFVSAQNFERYTAQDENFVFEEYDFKVDMEEKIEIKSLVSIYTNLDSQDPSTDSYKELKNTTYEKVLYDHAGAMCRKLKETGVTISGDTTAQRYANYSIARLIMAGENNCERSSITARTLTGPSYAGHVFWDNEIFDLPYFIFNNPEAARTMLMYRYNTLDGARKNREIENKENNTNYKGARFAWESTYSGVERTPASVINEEGQEVRIFTGTHEKHITPNIAYAVYKYWQVTGDDEFIRKYGAEIVFEAARYSQSILVEEEDGKLHTHNIIGPDEYHEEFAVNPKNGEKEGVHDNMYTNILIRHNLDIAVKTAEFLETSFKQDFYKLKEKINFTDNEITDWIKTRGKIFIAQDEATGIIEQFRGFDELKEVDFEYYRKKYGEVNAQKFDAVLLREYCCHDKSIDPDKNNYKVLKQPDVLMLMAMFPEEFSPAVQKANYEKYDPLTSHGSSLSTGIHSLVAARIGNETDAYKYYLDAGGMDVEDVMGNAANGIHAASLGGTWQALIKGFGGMYVKDDCILFDPHIPEKWEQLKFSVKYREQKICISATQEDMQIEVFGDENKSIPVKIEGDEVISLSPGIVYSAVKTSAGWQWVSQEVREDSLLARLTRNITEIVRTAFSD